MIEIHSFFNLPKNLNSLNYQAIMILSQAIMFPSEGNFYATSSRGRYGNASSVTGYLKHD